MRRHPDAARRDHELLLLERQHDDDCRDDAGPALQDEMIGRLPDAEVVTLDGGHIPAITRPAAFAEILADHASN